MIHFLSNLVPESYVPQIGTTRDILNTTNRLDHLVYGILLCSRPVRSRESWLIFDNDGWDIGHRNVVIAGWNIDASAHRNVAIVDRDVEGGGGWNVAIADWDIEPGIVANVKWDIGKRSDASGVAVVLNVIRLPVGLQT
jgi:hypothetical protein